MAVTLQVFLALLQVVTLVSCDVSADTKDEVEVKNIDAEDYNDDLDTQETGWIFNPIQKKSRDIEYITNKFIYPFSALKSPASSFGGSFPIYSGGQSYYTGYAGRYPSYSFSGTGNYYSSPKSKLSYYNPVFTPYKKLYPAPPYKTWYNKNYYTTGGYQVNTGTYAPDCYYPSASPASYSSGTPLNYYYSSITPSQTYGAPSPSYGVSSQTYGIPAQTYRVPSQTYGVPGFNFGAKAAISVASTPTPISYSSHVQPSTATPSPPGSYVWRASYSPQYSDGGSQVSGSPPSLPSIASFPPSVPSQLPVNSLPTIPPTPSIPTPTTPSPPPAIVSTPSSTPLPSFPSSVPSGPSSIPIPVFYSQSDDGISQEVIITPPPSSSKGHYVTSSPGVKQALPDSSYYYNQPPSYAVAYYPNVFYITNEQRSEKTSSTQSVAGSQPPPNDEHPEDSSDTPVSGDSQSTSVESTPATKSQPGVPTTPVPGLSTFYSSQTVDQTRVPVPYNSGQLVFPQAFGGFYSPAVPSVYSSVGAYSAFPPSAPALPPSGPSVPSPTVSSLGYSIPLAYNYGQSPAGYQLTRTTKDC